METKKNSVGENSTPKNGSEKPAKVENQSNSMEVSELQKQNEILLKRLKELEKEKPKSLDEQISYFERKKTLINNLELLKQKKTELFEALTVIQPLADNDDFEKKEFSLVLERFSHYNKGTEVFKISNPHIVANCIAYILKSVDTKILCLAEEIQK